MNLKDKKTNILMIMYGKGVGGAELQFIELANYLANKQYLVKLVILGGDMALNAAPIVDSRIMTKVYAYQKGFLNILFPLFQALMKCRQSKPEIIITTSYIGNIIGYLGAVFRKVRLISLQTVSKCMGNPIIDRYILRHFDILIAGANDIKQYLIQNGQYANKIQVIYNWVDFSKRFSILSPDEAKNKFGLTNQIVIGCVGRLHIQKGQLYLIRAFAKFIQIYPNSILLLAGDGPEKDILHSEIKHLSIENNVRFLGGIKGNDYNDFFKAVDIYIQPSIFEGLPRTLLDAMYFGKSIVASSANGNREVIVDSQNGLLVPSQDDESLYRAIVSLVKNKEVYEYISKNAAKDAKLNFDMKNQLTKIEKLLVL